MLTLNAIIRTIRHQGLCGDIARHTFGAEPRTPEGEITTKKEEEKEKDQSSD